MTAHTKAPWTVHSFGEVALSDPTELGLYEVEEANEEINDLVKTGQHEKAREVMAANQALIKAAPKMLEALRDAQSLVMAWAIHYAQSYGGVTFPEQKDWHATHRDIFDRVQDAIALAEGRIHE